MSLISCVGKFIFLSASLSCVPLRLIPFILCVAIILLSVYLKMLYRVHGMCARVCVWVCIMWTKYSWQIDRSTPQSLAKLSVGKHTKKGKQKNNNNMADKINCLAHTHTHTHQTYGASQNTTQRHTIYPFEPSNPKWDCPHTVHLFARLCSCSRCFWG